MIDGLDRLTDSSLRGDLEHFDIVLPGNKPQYTIIVKSWHTIEVECLTEKFAYDIIRLLKTYGFGILEIRKNQEGTFTARFERPL